MKQTKSGKARAVALTPTLAAELEAWWKRATFRASTDYVFASSTGTPLDGRNMIRIVFEPAKRKAGCGAVRFHDLRHSFASLLIAQGSHPKVVQEQLGHASIQITMDRYGHLFEGAHADVSAELERAWAASAASAPASTEGANDAVSFRDDAEAAEEIPAKAAA